MRVHMTRKASVVFYHNSCRKLKDFSRLHAVIYTAKVVVSPKWYKIETPFILAGSVT